MLRKRDSEDCGNARKTPPKKRKIIRNFRFSTSPIFSRGEKSCQIVPQINERTHVPRQSVTVDANITRSLFTPLRNENRSNIIDLTNQCEDEEDGGEREGGEAEETVITSSIPVEEGNVDIDNNDNWGDEIEYEDVRDTEVEHPNNAVGQPNELITKYFPSSILSKRFPDDEIGGSISYEEKLRKFDIFSKYVKDKPMDEIMQACKGRIFNMGHEKLMEAYGFCDCPGHRDRNRYRELISDILPYKPMDFSFLGAKKYKKPIWESNFDTEKKSSHSVGDVAILYILVQTMNVISEEAASHSLKIWKALLETDKGIDESVKVNLNVTYSGLLNSLNEEIMKKQKRIIICTTCQDKVHVFFETLESKKWTKDQIPVCIHCHGGNLSVAERVKKSPFIINRKGELVSKDKQFVLISNPSHVIIDIMRNKSDVFEKVYNSCRDRGELFQSHHAKIAVERSKAENDILGNLFVFADYRMDDIASYNHCASSVATGIQSLDFPQLGNLRNKFRNIVTSSISASEGSPWVVRAIQNYFFVQFMIYNYANPPIVTIRNSISPKQSFRIYVIPNKKKMDLSDLYHSERMKNSTCTNCRIVPRTVEVREGNKIVKRKFFDRNCGLERSVYTVILGYIFEETNEKNEFSQYRRGIKGLTPWIDLVIMYEYDHILQINQDILHRGSNLFGETKIMFTIDKREFVDFHIERGVAFHGIPRLLRKFTKLGSFKTSEKIDFFSMFSVEFLMLANESEEHISFFILFRKVFRILYSKKFDVDLWCRLFVLLSERFIQKFERFPKTFHHFFAHLFKNITCECEMENNMIKFKRVIIDVLMDDSTESAETFYSSPRRLIKRNYKYSSALHMNLHKKNYVPLILSRLNETLKNNPLIKNLIKKAIPVDRNVPAISGDMYNDYTVIDDLVRTVIDYFPEIDYRKISPFLVSLGKWIRSLLSSYTGRSITNSEKEVILEKMSLFLSSDNRNNLKSWPSEIEIDRFCKLGWNNKKYFFISKDYSKVELENLNNNVLFNYPTEVLEDDSGVEQVHEDDYFKFTGRVCYFLKVSISGLIRYVAIVEHHKRLGFLYFDQRKYDREILEFMEDVEIVEYDGTSILTIDIKLIKQHLLLLGVSKIKQLKLFDYSKEVRGNSQANTTELIDEKFRLVIKVNDEN